jgi:hypothetical protein
MKKPKPPKLIVDNKLPTEPLEEFTYEEFKVYAEQITKLHERYPELDALMNRAWDNDDRAMAIALIKLIIDYDEVRELLAEKKRAELRVVRKKRDS